MKFYFENLTLDIIVFYAVTAILLSVAWNFIVQIILKYILKGKSKPKHLFITLTLILFVAFMIITLLEPPNGFNH